MKVENWALSWVLFWIMVFVLSVAGWFTHVVTCLKSGAWGFLIAGAIAAPVGVIHGWGLWFGAW